MKNDYNLKKSEFDQFNSLDPKNQIKFLYEKELDYQKRISRINSDTLEPKKQTTKRVSRAKVIFIKNLVILLANNKRSINVVKYKFFEDGLILRKHKNFNFGSGPLDYKYKECYIVLSVDSPLCMS